MEDSFETTGTQATGNSQNGDSTVERYKQQMKGWEKKAQEAEEARKRAEERAENLKQSSVSREYNRVYKNGNIDTEYLKSLTSSDPDLANELAQQFTSWDGNSFGSANDMLNFLGWNVGRKDLDKDALKKELMDELRREMGMSNITGLFNNLPEAKRWEAQAKFNSLVGNRKLSNDEMKEIAEMSSMYVMRDQIFSPKKDEVIASLWAMNLWGISVNPSSTNSKNISDEDYQDMLGYAPHAYQYLFKK